MKPRKTTGQIIRELMRYFPGTYELNLAVAHAKREGWGKNWAGAAEALLRKLQTEPGTIEALQAVGVKLKEDF